ncbi:hypothetical protein EDEG_02111 [Edhazardia aedis USNM 41457]|uniref:Uncharacterized protein n=1 Tax=Edhazardia aedis (strain USNM 41457) TaxID=1003232 RepID=J9D7V3_EDHAE|nr:hypothetical protein EDEG_02111 [Edhazardia aedis USNM 41457]|eukprot:EJW03569.1 hypothetical protein EDEG_02111 [Edhazardia aedis USNM 41457]
MIFAFLFCMLLGYSNAADNAENKTIGQQFENKANSKQKSNEPETNSQCKIGQIKNCINNIEKQNFLNISTRISKKLIKLLKTSLANFKNKIFLPIDPNEEKLKVLEASKKKSTMKLAKFNKKYISLCNMYYKLDYKIDKYNERISEYRNCEQRFLRKKKESIFGNTNGQQKISNTRTQAVAKIRYKPLKTQ